MGVNLDYPDGGPDRLEVALKRALMAGRCRSAARGLRKPSKGRCPICSASATGEDHALVSPVADAIKTMALVEACYHSSAGVRTPIPEV